MLEYTVYVGSIFKALVSCGYFALSFVFRGKQNVWRFIKEKEYISALGCLACLFISFNRFDYSFLDYWLSLVI